MDLSNCKIRHIDLAGIFLCAVIAILGYYWGVRPVVQRHKTVAEQETQLKTNRKNLDELAGIISSLKNKLTTVSKALADSPIELQSAYSVNPRIAHLAELAGGSGIKIDKIQPGRPISSSRFQTVPIYLAGSGSFPAFVTMLRRLGETFADTAVVSFDLTANPANPAIAAEFQIDLLWYAAAAPARPGK